METSPVAVSLAYLAAFEEKQFDRVLALLHPDLEFTSPGSTTHTSEDYVRALRRLSLILQRNAVTKTFVEGNEVCVVYDFVTDTAAGTIPSVEWHTIEDGRIRAIRLYFDRVAFRPVVEEMARRASLIS